RDVPALLKLADIYVHYSKLENCPVILLEAARAGLPIAAIPNGGVIEIGEKLRALVRLHESDINASLDALRPLLGDARREGEAPAEPLSRNPARQEPRSPKDAREFRQSLGTQARRGFEAHFTREAMVEQYLEALKLRNELAEVTR